MIWLASDAATSIYSSNNSDFSLVIESFHEDRIVTEGRNDYTHNSLDQP